jgi:hypothetical protein
VLTAQEREAMRTGAAMPTPQQLRHEQTRQATQAQIDADARFAASLSPHQGKYCSTGLPGAKVPTSFSDRSF